MGDKSGTIKHGTNRGAFETIGNKKEVFEATKTKKPAGPPTTQGGGVDPFGTECAKEKDAMNMNAGKAFNESFFTKIEAMGDDYPKTSVQKKAGGFDHNKDDHLKTDTDNASIAPHGTDCGKGSYRNNVG